MATGLTIRDFKKSYRELQFTESGSIRLTEIEHNAYLQRLTIEVTNYDAGRAINFKTLPENTHWGYCTSFKGSSVLDSKAVKFAKQRVYDHINQGIWNYHFGTESVELLSSFSLSVANAVVTKLLDEGQAFLGFEKYLQRLEEEEDNLAPIVGWLLGIETPNDPDFPTQTDPYTAFPVASPFPDVFKFKADIPLSFKFRLESWYLVNPLVYLLSNPTDSSDETEGESEYPTPEAGDGDGGGENFPTPNDPDRESDPRDFGGGDFGEQGTWTVQLKYFDAGNNAPCNNVPITSRSIAGYSKGKPYLDVVGEPGPFGAPPVDLVTPLQRVRVANDCGVRFEGEPVFSPGQVVFP